jgi:hypothetical protein
MDPAVLDENVVQADDFSVDAGQDRFAVQFERTDCFLEDGLFLDRKDRPVDTNTDHFRHLLFYGIQQVVGKGPQPLCVLLNTHSLFVGRRGGNRTHGLFRVKEALYH